MPDFEKIKKALLNGMIPDIKKSVHDALDDGTSPQEILEKGLIAGMDIIGTQFRDGDIFVPELLVAAKTMHVGMDILKPLLTKSEVKHTARIVLGTVKGDFHDIGKNIVGMMLEGSGFEVVDIGIDQSSDNFVKVAREKNAQLLGISALLTTTMGEMGRVIDGLEKAGFRENIKVIVGGAPVSKQFADSIGAEGYAPDAGSAVEKCRELMSKS